MAGGTIDFDLLYSPATAITVSTRFLLLERNTGRNTFTSGSIITVVQLPPPTGQRFTTSFSNLQVQADSYKVLLRKEPKPKNLHNSHRDSTGLHGYLPKPNNELWLMPSTDETGWLTFPTPWPRKPQSPEPFQPKAYPYLKTRRRQVRLLGKMTAPTDICCNLVVGDRGMPCVIPASSLRIKKALFAGDSGGRSTLNFPFFKPKTTDSREEKQWKMWNHHHLHSSGNGPRPKWSPLKPPSASLWLSTSLSSALYPAVNDAAVVTTTTTTEFSSRAPNVMLLSVWTNDNSNTPLFPRSNNNFYWWYQRVEESCCYPVRNL